MEKKVKEFVSKSLIYLVTDNKLDRMSWKKAFNALAVKPEQVVFFEDFTKALRAMKERPSKVLISAYEIKEEKADSLLDAYREGNPNPSDGLCLVVTEQDEPTLSISSLELELDGVLKKPYNAQELDDRIHEIISKKAAYGPLEKAFYKALEQFRRGELEPVEAYLGSASEEAQQLEGFGVLKGSYLRAAGRAREAIDAYEEALLTGSYAAITGIFDTFVEENMHEEAFEAASDMLSRFPLHPKRLSNYVKVCILTANYHSFVQFAQRASQSLAVDREYAHQLAAGLAICGKSIGIADRKISIDASLRSIKLGREKSQIVDQALKNLLSLQEYGLVNEVISDLSEDEGLEEPLAIAEYRVLDAQGDSPFQIFQKGMELTNKGVHDFHVYEVLLKSAKQAGRKKESLEEMADDASKHHPEKSDYFRSLVA